MAISELDTLRRALAELLKKRSSSRSFLDLTSEGNEIEGNAGYFTQNLQNFKLDPKANYEVALEYLAMWPFVHNVSAALGNNTYTYTVAATPFSVVIPDGQYTFNLLNKYIAQGVINNGHSTVVDGADQPFWVFVENESIQRCGVLIYDATTTVTFAADSELLGFTAAQSPIVYIDGETITYGTNAMNMTLGVTAHLINLPGFIQQGYYGNIPSYSIYSVVPRAPPGYLFEHRPIRLEWHRVVQTANVSNLTVRITDQLGRLVTVADSEDNPTYIRLAFRRI